MAEDSTLLERPPLESSSSPLDRGSSWSFPVADFLPAPPCLTSSSSNDFCSSELQRSSV